VKKRVDEVWKSGEQVRIFLDGIRGAIPLFAEQLETMMRVINGLSLQYVLDLGCGDGVLTEAILSQYPDVKVTLLDFSAPMLEKARTRLEGRGRGFDFVEVDFSVKSWAEDLQKREAIKNFDLVVSGYAIHHQSEEIKKSIYKAIYELLNPGGVFINIDHVASHDEVTREISNSFFLDNLRAYHEAQRGPGDFERVSELFLSRMAEEAPVLSTVEAQCGWLSEFGFVGADCFFKSFELAVFGARRPS